MLCFIIYKQTKIFKKIRLTKENNKLNRIFDNYKFYKSFDYNKIQYISSEKIHIHNVIKNNNYDINKHHDSINYIANNKYVLHKIDGVIYMTEGYTNDITKAKNFIKDGNKYYEVKRKDN